MKNQTAFSQLASSFALAAFIINDAMDGSRERFSAAGSRAGKLAVAGQQDESGYPLPWAVPREEKARVIPCKEKTPAVPGEGKKDKGVKKLKKEL